MLKKFRSKKGFALALLVPLVLQSAPAVSDTYTTQGGPWSTSDSIVVESQTGNLVKVTSNAWLIGFSGSSTTFTISAANPTLTGCVLQSGAGYTLDSFVGSTCSFTITDQASTTSPRMVSLQAVQGGVNVSYSLFFQRLASFETAATSTTYGTSASFFGQGAWSSVTGFGSHQYLSTTITANSTASKEVVIRASSNSAPVDLTNATCGFPGVVPSSTTIATVVSFAGSMICRITFSNLSPNEGREFQFGIRTGANWVDGQYGTVRMSVLAVASSGGGGGGGGSSVPASRPASTKYEGPEILAVDNFRPILSGGKLTFTGKNLSAVSSATIGSLAASLSYDAITGLTIGTPAGLAPGKYDLVMQSSYGKLTHINAVTIKAPTPTQTIGFKGEGEYLNEAQVAQLVEFNSSLNADYEKVRCIVNAADAEVAKAIAVRVCAHVARGEARNVEVIQDVRSTYKGSGFWVRVYAKG
jgi:hypothetical protein